MEEQNKEVENLNKVITDLHKQENLIRDQNRNMMNQLEYMNKDSSSKSQLTANIKYLRQEKDILTMKLKVSQAETARI